MFNILNKTWWLLAALMLPGLAMASGGAATEGTRLEWIPVIALGYAASIVVHMWVNESYFT